MVELIVGAKGKGKTKFLLEKAAEAVKTASGNIVYIDKNAQHMYELNNKIRLIDASRYPLKSGDEFLGFVLGIISQDHDLEKVFLDSFLKNAFLAENADKIAHYVNELNGISKQFNVDFVLSISADEKDLDPSLKELISISL